MKTDLDALPPTTAKLIRSCAAYVIEHEAPQGAEQWPIRVVLGYFVGLLGQKLLPLATDPESLRAYQRAGSPNSDNFEAAIREALAERLAAAAGRNQAES